MIASGAKVESDALGLLVRSPAGIFRRGAGESSGFRPGDVVDVERLPGTFSGYAHVRGRAAGLYFIDELWELEDPKP